MSGLIPKSGAAATGGTGAGAGGGGAGATSTTGSTQLVGACVAVAAAVPHIAAAGAPPLIAVKAAQGSTCCGTAVTAADAAVELRIKEPAMHAPMTPLDVRLAMSFLRHSGRSGPQKPECINPSRSFIPPKRIKKSAVATLHWALPSSGALKRLFSRQAPASEAPRPARPCPAPPASSRTSAPTTA
jgi:hypothetical protein